MEIFPSLQGEGVWAGTPMTFVRLAGCNAPEEGLACVEWCDTRESWAGFSDVGAAELSSEQVARQVDLPRVCFTGGEPLLQAVEVEGRFPGAAVCLQPEAGGGHGAVQRTLDLVQGHSRWRLSLQIHKILGLP